MSCKSAKDYHTYQSTAMFDDTPMPPEPRHHAYEFPQYYHRAYHGAARADNIDIITSIFLPFDYGRHAAMSPPRRAITSRCRRICFACHLHEYRERCLISAISEERKAARAETISFTSQSVDCRSLYSTISTLALVSSGQHFDGDFSETMPPVSFKQAGN